jgi:hypothetical protein
MSKNRWLGHGKVKMSKSDEHPVHMPIQCPSRANLKMPAQIHCIRLCYSGKLDTMSLNISDERLQHRQGDSDILLLYIHSGELQCSELDI